MDWLALDCRALDCRRGPLSWGVFAPLSPFWGEYGTVQGSFLTPEGSSEGRLSWGNTETPNVVLPGAVLESWGAGVATMKYPTQDVAVADDPMASTVQMKDDSEGVARVGPLPEGP